MADYHFQMSYDKVLELGYVFHSLFLERKADFTAASPAFADPFAADFLDELMAADALPTAENDLAEQSYFSSIVYAKMEECRVHYRKLLLYVSLGWEDSESVEKAFGKDSFLKARSSALELQSLLHYAHDLAEKPAYKPVLINSGFVQADIDLLGSLAEELKDVMSARDDYRNGSVERTTLRKDAFGKFWKRMILISSFSKMIYKDSPASVQMFLLHPDISAKNRTKKRKLRGEKK